jgi:hypothetical protein
MTRRDATYPLFMLSMIIQGLGLAFCRSQEGRDISTLVAMTCVVVAVMLKNEPDKPANP